MKASPRPSPLLLWAALSVSAVNLAVTLTPVAVAQIDSNVIPYLRIQTVTPGVPQVGHANLGGTLRAGQLQGGGAGVTGVDAARLGGAQRGAFGEKSGANVWTGVNRFESPTDTGTVFNSGAALDHSVTLDVRTPHNEGVALAVSDLPHGQRARGALLSVESDQRKIALVVHGSPTLSNVATFLCRATNIQTSIGYVGYSHYFTGRAVRQYTETGGPSSVIPAAYGSVLENGAVEGGTRNFTVQRVTLGTYDVQVTGMSLDNANSTFTVTPVSDQPLVAVTAPAGGKMRVRVYSLLPALVDARFDFVVWVTNPPF